MEQVSSKARWAVLLSAALFLAGCGAAEKQKVAVQVPEKALPPAVLPPRSFTPLLGTFSHPFPDAIDILIAQADLLYSAGLADYRSGDLEKAREEFDQAISSLLESKFDIQADERLSAEFDKLVEDIHSVEMAALERGDTLAIQHYEPAPIESLAGLTFPVDPNVKVRVQKELQSVHSELPLVSNDLVAGVISYFQSNRRGQGFIRRVLQRVGLYRGIISEELQKEGLPQELIYVAAAESGFNPFALSRAGAKGIWQLMLGRALEYGLRKDRWVDEREDPWKSTTAAIRHLKDLYHMFGDWALAMAAYNCGPGNVQKAIEKTGYADFWTLRQLGALPKQTENYVPIIMATALIAKAPQEFGFDVEPDPPLATDPVVVGVPTDLRLIAQLIDRPIEELIQLNPSLLRWTTPANGPEFVLNLPAGSKEKYEQAIASIPPAKRVWWRAHKVEAGETLASIAKKYRVSPVAVAEVNQIERSTSLELGSRLVLPLAPGSEASLVRVRERGPRRTYRYRIQPGDTLELVADRFDVTPYQIRRWNNMKTANVVPGRVLRLYVTGTGSVAYRQSTARRNTSHRASHAHRSSHSAKAPSSAIRARPSSKRSAKTQPSAQ